MYAQIRRKRSAGSEAGENARSLGRDPLECRLCQGFKKRSDGPNVGALIAKKGFGGMIYYNCLILEG